MDWRCWSCVVGRASHVVKALHWSGAWCWDLCLRKEKKAILKKVEGCQGSRHVGYLYTLISSADLSFEGFEWIRILHLAKLCSKSTKERRSLFSRWPDHLVCFIVAAMDTQEKLFPIHISQRKEKKRLFVFNFHACPTLTITKHSTHLLDILEFFTL